MEWFCLIRERMPKDEWKGGHKWDLKDSLSRNDWNKSVLITERQPKRLLKRHRRGIPKWDGMVRERMPKDAWNQMELNDYIMYDSVRCSGLHIPHEKE